MNPVHKLLQCCQEKKPLVAVLGDSMEDHWLEGRLATCQDGCTCFKVQKETRTPGGAANAARQLENWPCEVRLLSFISDAFLYDAFLYDSFLPGMVIKHCCDACVIPVKKRLMEDGKIVGRIDAEADVSEPVLKKYRGKVLSLLDGEDWDAVLISDYDKGLFDDETIQQAIGVCNVRRIPVLTDAKREPIIYNGSVVQCNRVYAEKHAQALCISPGVVVTLGDEPPVFNDGDGWDGADGSLLQPVTCRNHVGAGDCFAAHLVLGLACDLPLEEAVSLAHSAGRVFVQHHFARPPYPHEVAGDLDPSGGKTLSCMEDVKALRRSHPGRIVVANGVFRIPHAGHAHLLQWARQQGDLLVVLVNDDESARRLRQHQLVMPLDERLRVLSSFSFVDYIFPFSEDDPCAILEALKADILVKGEEYRGSDVPGANLVSEVRFCPMMGDRHATTLEEEIKHGVASASTGTGG